MKMPFQLYNEDNLEVLRRLPDNSVDSVVADPPYGFGKEPDALAMLTDWIQTGHHEVKGKGFMGKAWDAFVPQPAQWREVYRVLKPGGHVLAFAGTRTQDLMTLGLRLAGFEIRDTLAWMYGSGFPKSMDVSKALDKMAGAEREVLSTRKGTGSKTMCQEQNGKRFGSQVLETAPATESAKQWEGWGTALKPALEPITLARKPLSENTVAANVLKWHTGAINVDGCRVHAEDGLNRARPPRTPNSILGGGKGTNLTCSPHNEAGRWPANVIHDGSEEVVSGFPDTKSGVISPHHQRNTKGGNGNTLGDMNGVLGRSFGDSGSAARFFYCAKTSAADRNEHLEDMPDRQWKDEGAAVPERASRPFNPSKNDHPTVKPTALMRYLVRLITPPNGVVLDPWMGSGSTGKACAAEGFRFIGIDSDTKHGYFEIAKRRVVRAYLAELSEPDFC